MTRCRRILVTGGAGFIGSNYVRHTLAAHADVHVTNLDKLTYAGNLENLKDLEHDPRYEFALGDVSDATLVAHLLQEMNPDAIVNFAAETHVDRSLLGALPFIQTNVCGTLTLLEAARRCWSGREGEHRFVQISTDEVYGDLGDAGRFTEQSPLAPNNPYSASKASADLLCRAYFSTYGLPIVITRCSNNYGPYQFPEKLIPLMIYRASTDQPLPIYGDGSNVRDWIHVQDHCRAIDSVLSRGIPGEVYNIGANSELRNIDLVRRICTLLGRPETLIEFVRDRPGHDRRYAIDPTKLRRELGWAPQIPFAQGLEETVQWYCHNASWVQACLTGEYRHYYKQNYGGRSAQ